MSTILSCELCISANVDITPPAFGGLVWHNEKLRVVLVDDVAHPGFCRVIWNEHAKEMTDLTPTDRVYLMDIVWEVEAAMRAVLRPEKINLASLGNVVPHLHWHVIPRFTNDAHFPSPIWSEARRDPIGLAPRLALLPDLGRAIIERMR